MEKVEQCFGVTVVTSSDNLYADLGFADAEGMHAKAVLACEMMVDIEREGLSEQRAAALLDIPWAEFSLILNGQLGYQSQYHCGIPGACKTLSG